jgi:bifunctional non-homologous end joining protein LigD
MMARPTRRKTEGEPGASPMPDAPIPMLCTLVDAPFDSPDWTFEPKFDGLRVLARFDGSDLTLLSRNGKPQGARFPEIVDGLREALRRPAILDGEVVCLDEGGKSSFRELQQRFHLDDPAEIRRRMEKHPAYLYAFDVLHLDGSDLTRSPLSRRQALLRDAVGWSDRIRRTASAPGRGIEAWEEACAAGEEGIVGKRLDGLYVAGRSDAWVKIKCVGRQEFVVCGWTDPQRSRVGLGALLVGYYEDGRLHYAGKVGTGYTREVLLDLRRRLEELGRRTSPFEGGDPPDGGAVHWVEPRLVAEIAFAEWTQNGLLRQPRYEGLRPDKKASECRRERPAPAEIVRAESGAPKTGGDPVPLEQYKAKRDFAKTREPSGSKKAKSHEEPIFVVQEHHASVHHFDFRLEADGVLKSWSVPKGPSMDPSVKRLAVQVEDHPVGYATFEGTIPKGQYGGGTVAIWDHGTYESLMDRKAEPQSAAEAIDGGHIEFVMHGGRLKGKFALIRMKFRGKGKPQWLLMKMKDEFAEESPESADESAAPAKKRVAKKASSGPKAASEAKSATSEAKTATARRKTKPPAEVELTHPDRVMYPDAGLTKADVFNYYRTVSGRLLPFLKDRPITLERLPEGLVEGGPHFWQKDTPDYYPAWIPRIELETERGKAVEYALVNDEATLLYLVNQGTLAFHVWASRTHDLDRPDFVLFDLDPGGAPFGDVVEVAHAVRDALDAQGAPAYVKTSGKTGLHVLTPWMDEGGFDEARVWALEVAGHVAAELPDKATTDIRKAKRGGRVYVDVMQNARGHHAVPPYVLRAVPGATVSTPLEWREVKGGLDPAAFTAKAVIARLKGRKADPMAGLLKAVAAGAVR